MLNAMGKRSGFNALRMCLDGAFDRVGNWSDVLLHANIHLIGPVLHRRLKAGAHIDPEVMEYLAQQDDANCERNRRILQQLEELLVAFSDVGIDPILLKGAALLVGAGHPNTARISRDIDLVVQPGQQTDAEWALERLGYALIENSGWGHSIGSFAKPGVVAAVDIHTTLPVAMANVVSLDEIRQNGTTVPFNRTMPRVPDPRQHVLLNVAHEMLHDRHLAKGQAQLRYLFELAELMEGGVQICLTDDQLRRAPYLGLALEAQDRLSEELLTIRLFPEARRTTYGAVLHARRMAKLQFRHLGHIEWSMVRLVRSLVLRSRI